MKKKGFSAIFIIPVVVLLLLIAGVFAYKLYSDGVTAKAAEETSVVKQLPGLTQPSGKPKSGYAGLPDPTRTPTPTIPVRITPMDVEDALKVIENDTGKSDFDNLDTESAKL